MANVSGYKPYDAGEFDAGAASDELSAETPVAAQDAGGTGAAQARGATPASGFVVADPGASLLAASMAGASFDGETGAAAAVDPSATVEEISAEMSELEVELEELYNYRDYLIAELEDPNLDYWDSMWLEWDLSDVEYEILILEEELGKIEEALWDKLWQEAIDSLNNWATSWSFVEDGRMAFSQGEIQRETENARREKVIEKPARSKHLLTQREVQAEDQDLLDRMAGKRPPPPPGSAGAKKELLAILDRMKDLDPGRESFEALRREIQKLRGPSRA